MSEKTMELAQNLNKSVLSVLSSEKLIGFEKAYLIAKATGELKQMLTKEYMAPIMQLQGNRLGFKTDKDVNKDGSKGPGYPEEIVKNCLIEAVLMGVQPFGNQFNIIQNNCYITKEGMLELLKNMGAKFEITPKLPRIKEGSAAVEMVIDYTQDGIQKTKTIDFAIKVNQYQGADAVIGKATRKARAWLYYTLTGVEVPEGETQDTGAEVVDSKIKVPIEDITLLYDMKKDSLTEDERKNAERVINNKEGNSYSKLLKFLQEK